MKKRIVTFLSVILLVSLVLSQLTFANNTSVEETGASKQSPEQIFDWTTDASHLSGDYNSVVYGKGVYVAVGKKGLISVSKDLKKWDSVFLTDYDFRPIAEEGFKTVLFNGDVFVAAGGRAVSYSSDGYNWNKVTIDYDDGKHSGFALSDDALIKYGQTKGKNFILTGTGVLAYSPDGINWRNLEGVSVLIESGGMYISGSFFSNVVYDGNKLVTICTKYTDDNPNKKYSIFTSIDGLVWEESETGDLKYSVDDFLSYIEGKYYISNYNYITYKNDIRESQDLISWKDSEVRADNICYIIDDVTYKLGDGIYSYKKDTGFAAEYKVIGNTSDIVPGDETRLNGLCKGDGKLVAVGTDGLVLVCSTANKGIWTQPENQSFKSIYSAAAGKDCMIAVGIAGQIIKSKDGRNWLNLKTNITQSLYSVIYDGKKFVAVGDKGTIAVSVNGDTWEVVPHKNEEDLKSIQKINNIYFAIGRNVILTSKDAKKWSVVLGEGPEEHFNGEQLSSVAFKDGLYYTVTYNNSFVYTSKDAVNWKQTSRLKGYDYTDLCFYKDRFIIVGRGTAISKDLKSEIQINSYIMPYDSHYKINTFKDFLLTGAAGGNILYSPDGIIWSNAGQINSSDCANAFVEFKGKYYGFTTNGMIISGTKKGKIPAASDITASYLYNYPDTVSNSSRVVTLLNQPIFKKNNMLLTPETISKIIGGNYSYDKSKKTVQINMGKKNIKFTVNSSYAVVNGKKTKMTESPRISGNSVYVPAKFAFNSLGYLFSYDSFIRRIYVTIDEAPKKSSVTFKPATFKNNDGNLYFQSVGYNGKTYAAVSNDGIICTSKDGMNWMKRVTFKDTTFSKILWNGKRFVLAGSTKSSDLKENTIVFVSNDGIKWTKLENIPSIKYICDGAVGANGRTDDEVYTGSDLRQTVLVSEDGSILTSKDGLVWEKSLERKAGNWFYVCWNKGTYYVSGRDNGIVYTSKDGLKWSLYNSKIQINRMISSGGSLWAIQTYGTVNTDSSKLYRSDNGKEWSFVNDVPQKIMDEIIYTGKNYVLAGHKSVIYSSKESFGFGMYSKDGDLWNFIETPKNLEFINDFLRFGNITILATSKGLLILSEK